MRRWMTGLALLCTLLALPRAALAGGWSVVTLDRMPDNVQAGAPFTIGFVVRQHGKTPMADLSPTITLVKQSGAQTQDRVQAAAPATGDNGRVTVTARPDGDVGHYAATITLPSAGAWTWTIDAFGPVAEMSPLTVSAAPAQINQGERATATQAIAARNRAVSLSLAGAAALIMLAATVLVARQRRRVGAVS